MLKLPAATEADCACPHRSRSLSSVGHISGTLSRVPVADAFLSLHLVGGTIGIAIASSVFGTKLGTALHEFAPDAPYELVRNSVQVRRRASVFAGLKGETDIGERPGDSDAVEGSSARCRTRLRPRPPRRLYHRRPCRCVTVLSRSRLGAGSDPSSRSQAV